MPRFSVWAPIPQTVALELNGRRYPMQHADAGWWIADVAGAPPDATYRFILDDGDALPDPRSSFQPQGVHGPSRLVDHAAFQWHDASWQAPPLAAAVVYELHTGTFTPEGTFDAAIGKLDYLRDLGVTHVEIMPVNEFPGARGWGYDGTDLYAPHHAYGGPDGLKRLVDACHQRGLAILLDVVYNHIGPSGNYLGRYGPYFTDRYATPWGPAVNLDGPGSDEVRRFICDNALMWLRDYHFDGLRIDAVHAILDTSAVHLLEQLSAEVDELEARTGRHLVLIAESDLNDPRLLWPRGYGGYGMDAQWSDDFHHALHTVLTGERMGYYADFGPLAELARALQQVYVYAGRYSPHRRRTHGRSAAGLAGTRFLGYAQNHDQVGNRAMGDRLSQLVSPGRLRIAAALVLTAPFVPMLFQGEEWGASTPFQYFTDHQDPGLGDAVRDGRRREFAAFGWDPQAIPDPQDPATFQRSRLNWDELAHEPHAELLAWHRSLIRLRSDRPALRDGRLDQVRVRFDERARWLVVERGDLTVVCNLASVRQPVPLPAPGGEVLLASAEDARQHAGSIELPPDAVAILQSPSHLRASASARGPAFVIDPPLG